MTPLISEKEKPAGLTHRQIAEELGVSRQLVGFALRGEGRMSDEVRQRILDVARISGYDQYSNGAARSMAARRYGKRMKTGLMAVLFAPTFGGRPISSVPFFMPFFDGLENEAIELGIDLMLCPLRPQGLPRLVREGQVDGIVCLVTDKMALEPLLKLDVPLVNILIAHGRAEEVSQTPILSMDAQGGGNLATRHLIGLGHSRIAFLGFSGPSEVKKSTKSPNWAGYCDAMRKNGLVVDESLVDTQTTALSVQAGAEALHRLLERRPEGGALPFTGLVCANDLLAMGAVRALKEAGLRVPEDVSVVGFDDVSTQYAFEPALTSIRFPREEMGRRAVRLLSEAENQNPASLLQTPEVFPFELIERDSTARCQQ